MHTFFRSALFPLIVIVLLVYLVSQTLLDDRSSTRQISYAEAERLMRDEPQRIDEITLRPREREALVELVDGATAKTPDARKGEPAWWSFLTGIVPFAFLVVVWIALDRHRDRRRKEDLSAQVRNPSTS